MRHILARSVRPTATVRLMRGGRESQEFWAVAKRAALICGRASASGNIFGFCVERRGLRWPDVCQASSRVDAGLALPERGV